MAAVMLEVVLSPARASTTCHDKIDGWDAGIEKHVGGTPLGCARSGLDPVFICTFSIVISNFAFSTLFVLRVATASLSLRASRPDRGHYTNHSQRGPAYPTQS